MQSGVNNQLPFSRQQVHHRQRILHPLWKNQPPWNRLISTPYCLPHMVPRNSSHWLTILRICSSFKSQKRSPIKLVHSSQCLICLSMYGITLIPVPPRRLPHPVQAPPHRERVCNAMVVVNHTPGLTVLNWWTIVPNVNVGAIWQTNAINSRWNGAIISQSGVALEKIKLRCRSKSITESCLVTENITEKGSVSVSSVSSMFRKWIVDCNSTAKNITTTGTQWNIWIAESISITGNTSHTQNISIAWNISITISNKASSNHSPKENKTSQFYKITPRYSSNNWHPIPPFRSLQLWYTTHVSR